MSNLGLPVSSPPDHLYWGLKVVDWATLAALVFGPLLALLISMLSEQRRRAKEPKLLIARTLFLTRHLPGDSSYSAAINAIPFTFEGDKSVIDAWQKYHDAASVITDQENMKDVCTATSEKQVALIMAINRHLGIKIPEDAVRKGTYASGGLLARDTIYLQSLQAMPEIANVLKQQLAFVISTHSGTATRLPN